MKKITDYEGLIVGDDGYAYSIVLKIKESYTGWAIGLTPYEAFLEKLQTGGYGNGPWPADRGKRVPFRHVLTLMEHEGLSFSEALGTQFGDIRRIYHNETLWGELKASAEEAVKKVRRRIEDRLRKMRGEEIFELSRQLDIEGDELTLK